jgi:hypothetical protein
MNEYCPGHDGLKNDMAKLMDDTRRIIVGMFGSFENPGHGFIDEVRAEMANSKREMERFKEDISEIKGIYSSIQKYIARGVWGVIGFIGTGTATIVIGVIQGWIK